MVEENILKKQSELIKEEIMKVFSVKEEDILLPLRAIEIGLDKKALDPAIIQLKDITIIADYFVILTVQSKAQARAIAEQIEAEFKEKGCKRKLEGYEDGTWVLMDYKDVVVHIFQEKERTFYDLEGLWGDGPIVRIDYILMKNS